MSSARHLTPPSCDSRQTGDSGRHPPAVRGGGGSGRAAAASRTERRARPLVTPCKPSTMGALSAKNARLCQYADSKAHQLLRWNMSKLPPISKVMTKSLIRPSEKFRRQASAASAAPAKIAQQLLSASEEHKCPLGQSITVINDGSPFYCGQLTGRLRSADIFPPKKALQSLRAPTADER